MKRAANGHGKRVLREYRRFEAALPKLLRRYRDRWVVFLDGEVKADYAEEYEAYLAGVKKFGNESPFVVAQVGRPVTATIGPALRL